jgi:hypothetical protein
MSMTITIADPLATRLQLRAEAERVAVDDLASRLLENGIQSPLEPEQWAVANRRRVALIEKRFAGGLADHEREELQRLQELADRQLEELDALMLKNMARMEAAARKALEPAK